MSNKATLQLGLAALVLAASAAEPVWGQAAPDWRRVGNAAMDLQLAGLATGPVDRVWYSAAGDQLFIRTSSRNGSGNSSGKLFESNDFDRWIAAPANTVVPPVPEGRTLTPNELALPEEGAQVRNPSGSSPRVYAFGRFVYRSDDSGKNWENVTAFHGPSIVGDNLRDLAVSATNEDDIVVAGSAGVFRSLDGGQSWSGLNENLPNLPSMRILSLPEGPQGAQVELPGARVVEWQPGERQAWRPADDTQAAGELAYRQILSATRGTEVTALAIGEQYIYTGMADGRIIVSTDNGVNWQPDQSIGQGGAVTAFWVNPDDAPPMRCSPRTRTAPKEFLRGFSTPSTAARTGTIFPRIFRMLPCTVSLRIRPGTQFMSRPIKASSSRRAISTR